MHRSLAFFLNLSDHLWGDISNAHFSPAKHGVIQKGQIQGPFGNLKRCMRHGDTKGCVQPINSVRAVVISPLYEV